MAGLVGAGSVTRGRSGGRVRGAGRAGRDWLRTARRASPAQVGSMSMATVVVSLAVAVALLVASMVVGYVMATHRSRAAADLAALSAATWATQVMDEGQPCQQAGHVATDNGAELVDCEIVRAGDEVAVKVEVSLRLRWAVPGLPDHVGSVSYAGNPA